ncbi:MAG: BREX system P-loop protein BrxC [Coprothermobacterota bacterium]|nr:BREX system P-loop protein BrxC [Coprothermobacterota bacterium]
MNIIGDLLARDLSLKIEEVIKVDQLDEQAVYRELTEYVPTDRIRAGYAELLKAMSEAKTNPHEGVGIWVSGFFGSGKSSFAKNLGYVLSNRTVLGRSAGTLFKAQMKDPRIDELVDFLNRTLPTRVVMFDIQAGKYTSDAKVQNLSSIFYSALLDELGYAPDFSLAELEISLEREGKLEAFIELFDARYGNQDKEGLGGWVQRGRISKFSLNRAGAILYELEPQSFPTPDSFVTAQRGKEIRLDPETLVGRTFELAGRRASGATVAFIVDEVGQYVSSSADRVEELRKIVELFGVESCNRVKARLSPGPVWVLVTSQEKLDEVVSALGDKKTLIAKMRDRFKYEIDLHPADIQEVAGKRVLSKKADALLPLRALFSQCEGQLNLACRLERTSRKSELEVEEFAQFYPYLPHYIELSIDIMSGIRLQPGAPKHTGGSARTIIKQTYEMLVNPRTDFAHKPIGALVTLDRIYDLVEGALPSEQQRDVYAVSQSLPDDPMALRVMKALCLMEFIRRDLPRSEGNIAALLVEQVGQAKPLQEVNRALGKLQAAQFVRPGEDGWKMQTAVERKWSEVRKDFSPKPRERKESVRDRLNEIFADPKLKTYRYKELRTLRVGVATNGESPGEQVNLILLPADDPESLDEARGKARQLSREHLDLLYWTFALSPEIDALVREHFASKQMIDRYQNFQGQQKLLGEEAACLEAEKVELNRWTARLRDKLQKAMEQGYGAFAGTEKDASSLGASLAEAMRAFFTHAVPRLYPKLEMGAVPVTGKEVEDILKASSLSGLPAVFYSGPKGLNLVTQQGSSYRMNSDAEIAKEVMGYLVREHSYGNRDSCFGKELERHFGGIGYGWETDVLKLAVAFLFRAGSLEITHAGVRYDSYAVLQSRAVLTNNITFRQALFTPVEAIPMIVLARASQSYTALFGQNVDVEKQAIASSLKDWAGEQSAALLQVEAQANAHRLPILSAVRQDQEEVQAILGESVSLSVTRLADGKDDLLALRDRIATFRRATKPSVLQCIQAAQKVVDDLGPALLAYSQDGALSDRLEQLRQQLQSCDYGESLEEIRQAAQQVREQYLAAYHQLHAKRHQTYSTAIERLCATLPGSTIAQEQRELILQPLHRKACAAAELPSGSEVCPHCKASLGQLDSDLPALSQLEEEARKTLEALRTPLQPGPQPRALRVTAQAGRTLRTKEEADRWLESLRQELYSLLADGNPVTLE